VKTANRLKLSCILIGRLLLALALLASVRLPASAAEKGDVVVELKAQKIVAKADAQTELVSAEKAAPGETVLYTAVYRNQGKASVQGLQATLPIPDGMEYVADSATPAGAWGSTDGAQFQPLPLKRTVKAADGTEREEAVPLAQYRTLRWNVGALAPGASTTVSAKARISLPPTPSN
jgi:uncharacterized repeat protein (TIGR01451 family)